MKIAVTKLVTNIGLEEYLFKNFPVLSNHNYITSLFKSNFNSEDDNKDIKNNFDNIINLPKKSGQNFYKFFLLRLTKL